MAIEAILFDLGKVIIDFSIAPVLQEMGRRSSKSAAEFEAVLRDSELAFRYESGAITTQQFYDHLCIVGGLQMTMAEFRCAWASVFAPELMISENLLRALHARYPMIIVSNTNEIHVNFIADRFRVFDYFAHKVFSHEVRAMKPDRRIFDRAVELSGKSPDALFFIDDREENVAGARALGIHAHQFKSEAGLVVALAEAGIDVGRYE